MISDMVQQAAAMHVARIRSGYTDKQGQRRDYESRYLRRTYRDGSKGRHETLANLSGLAEPVVDAIEAALKGTELVPGGAAGAITGALPPGHVAAGHALAGQPGPPGRSRCGCYPATPATRPPSPRSSRSSGTSSAWPRWLWSATAA